MATPLSSTDLVHVKTHTLGALPLAYYSLSNVPSDYNAYYLLDVPMRPLQFFLS